jgi:hypothetical protein
MTFNRIMITGPTGLVLYDTEEVGNARGHYALLWEISHRPAGHRERRVSV